MLDSDLAILYECSNGTKTINQAVKRHLNNFQKDICFNYQKLNMIVTGPNLGLQV